MFYDAVLVAVFYSFSVFYKSTCNLSMSFCNVYLSFRLFYLTFVSILNVAAMKTNYLLPNQFKKIGWILFIPSFILGLFFVIYQFQPKIFEIHVLAIIESGFEPWATGQNFCSIIKTNIVDELIGLVLIISSLFIAFSKERLEDELISKIRLESLVWATYVNYLILILAIIFVFGMSFLWVLVFNMFTILFFFIIRFNWALYKTRKLIQDEK